eukprot:gene25424-31884_t
MGQQDKAIDDLTLVLSINPEHINAAFARAACFNTIGQFSRAIEDYNFALLKDTQMPSTSTSLREDKMSEIRSDHESSDLDSPIASIPRGSVSVGQHTVSKRPPPSIPQMSGSTPVPLRAVPPSTPPTRSVSAQPSPMSSSGASLTSGVSVVTPLRPQSGQPRSDATQQSQPRVSVPSAADEHHARGYQLRRGGDFLGAVEEYSRALQLDGRHFKAFFNRGFALDKLGRFDEAVADYTRAVEIEPSNAFAHYNRGISRDRMGALEAALVDFSKAIELQPATADFYHNRAFCYRKLDRLAAAVEDYSQSLRLAPNHFKALFNRACCLEQLGALEQAVADTTKALEIQPNHSGCLLSRALLHEKLNHLDESLLDFGTALANGADRLQVLTARPRVLSKAGRFQEALVDLTGGLSLSTSSEGAVSLLFLRGMCHKSLEDFASAVADFGAVLQQDPKHVPSLTQRGLCHRKLGLLEAAARDYDEIIRVDPQNVKAYNNRAFVAAKLGRFESAVADYTVVIGLTPESSHAYHNRGISFDKLGLFDQAIADFTKVLELDSAASPEGNNSTNASQATPRPVSVPSGISGGNTAESRATRAPPSFLETPQRFSMSHDTNNISGRPEPFTTPQQSASAQQTPPPQQQQFRIQSGSFHAPRSAVQVATKSAGADAAVFARRTSPIQMGPQSLVSSAPSKWSSTTPPSSSSPADDDIQVRLSRVDGLLGGQQYPLI